MIQRTKNLLDIDMESSLGFSLETSRVEKTAEEEDQIQRSSKKVKRRRSGVGCEADEGHLGRRSYAETLRNGSADDSMQVSGLLEEDAGFSFDEDDTCDEDSSEAESEDEGVEGIEVIEDPFCPSISISQKERERLGIPWKQSLIFKLVGKTMGYNFLSKRLFTLWRPRGSLDIIDIGHEFYIAKFGCNDDFQRVLMEGPWIVADHYLSVRMWEPDFDPSKAEPTKLAVWVRFPDLAIEYFDTQFLRRLGSRVGRVIKVDGTTQKASRGKFARVCVEVDLTKPLLSKFSLNKRTHHILYESMHMLCYGCGRFGHQKEQCSSSSSEAASDPNAGVEGNAQGRGVSTSPGGGQAAPEDTYGPWMVVQKARYRKDNQKSVGVGGGGVNPVMERGMLIRDVSNSHVLSLATRSRFEALRGEDQAGMEGEENMEREGSPARILSQIAVSPRRRSPSFQQSRDFSRDLGGEINAEHTISVQGQQSRVEEY